MNIKEAFEYLLKHYQNIVDDEKNVIGVAYTHLDDDADFYIIELSIEEPNLVDEDRNFIVSLEGGDISSSEGIDDCYSGSNIEDLLGDLPKFMLDINFQIYKLEFNPFGLQTEFALRSIFPTLPDPDEQDLSMFRDQAIELITSLNKTVKWHPIDHLASLAEEESFLMPQGLSREERREWAKKNLS